MRSHVAQRSGEALGWGLGRSPTQFPGRSAASTHRIQGTKRSILNNEKLFVNSAHLTKIGRKRE
jgi:hypothetical protein